MKLALDANTYRAFMDGAPITVAAVREASELHVPVPVLAALRFGFAKGTKGRQNEAVLAKFLDSPRVRVNDVWIAALVLQHGSSLHSLDSDFDTIPQLPRVAAR